MVSTQWLDLGLGLLEHGFCDKASLDFARCRLGHDVGKEDLLMVRTMLHCGESIGEARTCFGSLNLATRSVSHVFSSAADSFWPSLTTTARPTSWPYISSSSAKLTASDTAGCCAITLSSSIGLIFSPPLLINSLMRPVMIT